MSKLLYQLTGVRGRSIAIYDRKVVISTKAGVGSFLTGNVTDGEKTIFFHDVVGVQFKKSGGMIGYLQFETGSVQMNNQNSNMFSENTFTFEANNNGITNEQMEAIYHQVCDIIEEIKYGDVSKGGQPIAPVAPVVPVAAVAPVIPAAPVAPAIPEAPVVIEESVVPEIPAAPVVAEAPVAPPVVPFAPVAVEEPVADTITCPHCGGTIPSFASFCTNCGQRLR